MYGRHHTKRNGRVLYQRKVANPRAAFEARKARIGETDRSTGMFCEFFTPEQIGGNGKFRIEHWHFGRCTMVELYEAA